MPRLTACALTSPHAFCGTFKQSRPVAPFRLPEGTGQWPKEAVMSKVQVVKRLLIAAALAAGIPAVLVYATTSSGSTSTLLGRATFKSFKVERKQLPVNAPSGGRWGGETDRDRRRQPVWEVEAESRPALDIATQTITFQPGGHSGWHSHPGPVFISVIS